jgi:hypothetical protein
LPRNDYGVVDTDFAVCVATVIGAQVAPSRRAVPR